MTAIASCGHTVDDLDSMVSLSYESETCDPLEGYIPCTIYGTYCPSCAEHLRKSYDTVEFDKEYSNGYINSNNNRHDDTS